MTNFAFFGYKKASLTYLLLISYTYIHLRLTGIYVDTTLDQLIEFSAKLPFGQRLLIPAIAHTLAFVLPFSTSDLFFILELLSVSLLYLAMKQLMQEAFSETIATLLSWLFLLLLPLITVINYRYTINAPATFYYPYDSASLFFMTAGFLLCLRSQWFYLIPLIGLATFNRESSLLLVLLIPALHWARLSQVLKPMGWALVMYIAARLLVLLCVHDLPGTMVEWVFQKSSHPYFQVNLYWILNDENLLMLLYCFAGLPLFWFTFYDYIPRQYQPIRYIALWYFIGLLFVGNFMEPRIFGEILILLYLPVCAGINRWVLGCPLAAIPNKSVFYYINRYAILTILALIVLLRHPILTGLQWYLGTF